MRILVVEDEPAIADAVRTALVDDGHAVDLVANGRDALEWASAAPYGLVILDVILPGMDGFAVCRTLRTDGFTGPILMLTALTGVEDRVTGLDHGADDYLGKPFAIAELKARVRALARRHGSTGSPRIEVGDLVLDPSSLGVWHHGREVRLTAREFAFLELLARHPGQVFTQEHLIDALWSVDSIPGSNVVEVYVRSLRRKLDAGRRDGVIETIRGAGYRVRPAEAPGIAPSEDSAPADRRDSGFGKP
ncbi:MAG TPA: response regulator transcription factor [Candidatus Limnocylindrales bacterium]|nr:response regulator transcription factor [Candidatus Limnocylindrales bacterium]